MSQDQELQEQDETAVVPAAVPQRVTTFEGDLITALEGKLPALTIAGMENAYPLGTQCQLEINVRVKSVRIDESRTGDLVRQHIFQLINARIVKALDPDAEAEEGPDTPVIEVGF